MNENIDINKELKAKNEEMLLNKKKIDLDTSMESLMVFYNNYSNNIASEINNRICSLRNINPDSEQGKVFYNTITSFLFLTNKKLGEIINNNIETIKNKIGSISDDEYTSLLNNLSLSISNQMFDYYVENINMLSSELNQDVDEEIKNRINDYLYDLTTVKMMNMLRDKIMFAIKVINNNSEENKEVIESINEKVFK